MNRRCKRWSCFISILMVIAMILPIIPVEASEVPVISDQVTSDQPLLDPVDELDTTSNSNIPKEFIPLEEMIEEKAEDIEADSFVNRISGLLWLDIFEDADDNTYHGDGIFQSGEQPLSGYMVSLYKADDRGTTVQTAITDNNGEYQFEDMEPGHYIVGISKAEIDGTEYMLPVVGMTKDNKFVDFAEDNVTIYSKRIEMDTDTIVTDVNAGMRTPKRIQARAGLYQVTRNDTEFIIGTYATLDAAASACLTTTPCTITVMGDDTDMGSKAVNIPKNKDITVTSDSSANYMITQTVLAANYSSGRHFEVEGILTLKNITLSGLGNMVGGRSNGGVYVAKSGNVNFQTDAKIINCNSVYGGGVYIIDGNFTMEDGEIIGNGAVKHGGGVFVHLKGNFIMKGGKITDNHSVNNGGGLYIEGQYGTFESGNTIIEDGEISGNTADQGGGVYVLRNAFTMEGGSIMDNTSLNTIAGGSSGGGGIHVTESTFAMIDGEITDNTSINRGGGGIYMFDSSITMNGGEITNNRCGGFGGGGIYMSLSTVTMNGGEISANITSGSGGGVYVNEGLFTIDQGSVTNNIATSDGGGIYSVPHSYADPALVSKYYNIGISSIAVVSGNTAGQPYTPPANAAAFTARATNPFNGTLLDNDNINYRNPKIFLKYKANNTSGITYNDPNGYVSGNQVAALSLAATGIPADYGYVLNYWCTTADGTGTKYYPGDMITMGSGNLVLYAKWVKATYTINIRYVDRNNVLVANAGVETATHGEPFTATATLISGKTYAGWYIGATAPELSTVKATTMVPHIASALPADHNTTITLVYDSSSSGGSSGGGGGGGGTTPSRTTYTITEKHMSGTNVLATYNRTVNEGSTYNGTVDSGLSKSYTYHGYHVENSSLNGIAPNLPTITNVQTNYTVVMEYSAKQHEITVTYEYHANDGKITVLPGSQKATVARGSSFTPTIPNFKQKVQTGWTLNGKAQTGAPTVTAVTGTTTIVLIYQQDMDEDGVHDYTIKELCVDHESSKILQSRTIYVAAGRSYRTVAKEISHHRYIGYRIDAGKLQKVSNPAILSVNADHTVELIYTSKVNEVTASLGGQKSGKKTSDKGFIHSPETGDKRDLALTYALVGVLLGGIIVLTEIEKRKRRKRM